MTVLKKDKVVLSIKISLLGKIFCLWLSRIGCHRELVPKGDSPAVGGSA